MGLRTWFISWGIGGGGGALILGGSLYQLIFVDPISAKRCDYSVYCFGIGVGLPKFGVTSPVTKWDDGEGDCTDCTNHEGYGALSYASAMVGMGFSIGGILTIPNGPNITGDLLYRDGGAFRVGTGLMGCRFALN